MSAPVMRRSFNLHFNGGNTHVEADCTASRTLAELLADSLFSAFPQFASLRLYSAGSNSRSKELEKEMEKYYVCKAPASTLTSPLVLPGSRTGAPSSAPTSSSTTTRGRKRGSGGGEDMVEIPLSTATQIAPCDLFVISLPADGGSLVAGKASVANSGSSTRRGRRKASPPRPGRRRAAAIEAAPPPRTKRKYTRRATAPVEGSREDTIEGEEDERGGSGSGSDENDEDEDGASGSEGTDSGSDSGGSGSDGTSSDSGGSRSVLSTSSSNSVSDDDEVGDGNDDDSASGSARSSGDDADGSSRSGSDSDDDDAGSSDSDSNSTRRRKRRPRRTRTPGRPRGRTASRRTTTKASAPTSATAPAVGRPKRKYTRRVKKDAAEEEESGSASKAAPAKRTRRRTRTKSAPRRTSSRRSATATAEAAAAAAAGGAAGGKTSTPTTTATTTVAGGGASRSASGSPVLVTPDGQPIKRKRGRPPKNAPRYVEAVPAATQASSPTTTTTHTRANSTVSNDPIPLPPRRKRNRTRSPGPSAAGGMGADGTVMGGDSLWKSKGGLVGGTRQPQPSPEELGIAAGSSAPTSASSLSVPMAGASSLSGIVAYEGGPPDSLGGVPVPAGDSGAVSLSRKDAQLRAIEQQRQRIFAAGDFVGGGKSFAPGGAGGGEGYTEEELRQAALLQEHQQQLRLLQQRRLLVRLNDYSASPPPSPPSHAATTTMSGPSSEANRTALASAMTNGFVENGGNSPAVDGTTEEKAKAEEESSTIRAPAASDVDTLAQLFGDVDGGGCAMARQGTFSVHRFQQPQVPRSAGPTVPSHFRLPLLLQRAAQVANPSAVAAATTAASEGHTSTFLLSHPLACQAVPEVSVYGGLASACEEAMLPDPSPRAAPLSASTTRSAAAERSGNGRDKTKERGIPGRSSTAAASTEQRASSVKREKLTEEDASDEADGGKQSGAAGGPAFAYPTVSPFALLDEDELHALATRRMFTAPPSTASAAAGDGGGGGANKSAVESDVAGEWGEVAYCDPAQVSISLPIVVGGCVRLVNPESREKSHQWTVYVRGLFNGYPPQTSSGSSRDAMAGATGRPSHPACFPEKEEAVQEEETDYLSHFVDHVTFILDRSFTPCVRTVYKAPFEVTEVGWGEFVVSIHVHLRFPGYSPFTRAMKRTLKCYLSGSGGRAALIASTGPGRGASGLDPVTSMNLTPASNRGGGGGGGVATMASNTDTNLLVDSFLDVNFNSAARSLYYRGPFLSPHLHHDTDVYLPMRNEEEAAAARHYLTDAIPSRRHRGVAGGHHKNEEEAREGDKDDDCADAEEAEHELYHLLADYLRDREEENADMQDNPSSYGSEEYAYNGAIHATTAGGGGGGGGGSGSGDGVKRELSQTGSGVNNSEDSLPTSAPASPTSSLTVVDGADFGAVHSRSESGSGSAVPAVRQPKKRGPKPSRRGVTARGASSQSQAVGGAASASTTLRAGHKGNVAVLSHLLRFSHRQRSTPLIPPQGDVRAPKKFEHLGYTLVPEPVVTENYDELVIPLHGLTHSVKCARHYTGLSRLLAKEEARHAELVSQFEAALHGGGGGGSGFAKDPVVKGDGAETRDKGDRMDVVAPRTEAEHLQHIRQCEDRIAVLQKLMVELTRVVRADRRLLRSAALLEGRLRDALQVYLLSHRPPATPSAAATDAASSGVEGLPFAPYMAQLLPQLPRQPPGDPSSNDGDSSSNNNNTKRRDRETFTGGVSSWPHICSHGNAAEKDVLLAFSYLSSVAESALAEGWLGFALLQARRRVLPATTGAAAAVGAAGLDTFATSEASRTTSTSPSAAAAGKPSANSTTFARVKREVEGEEEQKGKGDFTRGLWVRLFTSFYSRLPSSVFPLTSVEFDLAAATLLASLLPIQQQQQQQQQRSQTLGEGSAMADSDMSAMHVPSSPVDSMSTTCALLFADVLLPRAMELGTAVLHTRQLSGGSGDKGKHKEGMEGVHVALSSAFFLRQSETPSQSGGERKEEEEECEGREDLARRVLSGHLQFPLYTDPIPGSQTDEQRTSWGCGHNQSSSSGSVVFDPLTASMIWQASSGSSSTGHGHGNHGQSRPQSAAAAAAATAAAALLRSRGLLPPPLSPSSSSLISSAPPPPSGPSSSSPLPFPPSASTTGAGAASATPTFASGESKLQYGDVADVAQLRAMKTALLEAIHAMRVEAAKRQAVLSLRQM